MTKLKLGNIIPRWEWRTFGQEFGKSEGIIRKYPCTREIESDEIYILTSKSEINCKIRGELIDIKMLEKVNADALEQWVPILKVSFPAKSNEINEVLQIIDVKPQHYTRDEYTHEQFLNAVIDSHRDLKIVPVSKKRCGWLIDNAIVEIADLVVDGEPIRTIAIEQTDPGLVISTIRTFRLDVYQNINYTRELKSLKEMV